MNDNKKKLSKNIVSAVCTGLVLAFAIMYLRGILEAQDAVQVMMALSDGFFVAGLLYTGFGLLVFASHQGVLDIISYGFRSVLYLFMPFKKNRDEGGYYEYKMKKKESRKGVPFFIIWVGLAFILISVIFLVLYYHI